MPHFWFSIVIAFGLSLLSSAGESADRAFLYHPTRSEIPIWDNPGGQIHLANQVDRISSSRKIEITIMEHKELPGNRNYYKIKLPGNKTGWVDRPYLYSDIDNNVLLLENPAERAEKFEASLQETPFGPFGIEFGKSVSEIKSSGYVLDDRGSDVNDQLVSYDPSWFEHNPTLIKQLGISQIPPLEAPYYPSEDVTEWYRATKKIGDNNHEFYLLFFQNRLFGIVLWTVNQWDCSFLYACDFRTLEEKIVEKINSKNEKVVDKRVEWISFRNNPKLLKENPSAKSAYHITQWFNQKSGVLISHKYSLRQEYLGKWDSPNVRSKWNRPNVRGNCGHHNILEQCNYILYLYAPAAVEVQNRIFELNYSAYLERKFKAKQDDENVKEVLETF